MPLNADSLLALLCHCCINLLISLKKIKLQKLKFFHKNQQLTYFYDIVELADLNDNGISAETHVFVELVSEISY